MSLAAGCRLRLAAAHGVAGGCHSGAAAASVQRGRGCCWGGGGALCHRQWSGACLWSGRGGCRRFSPRGPRGGAPPPWAFFGEGPEKGGSGGLPRRCLQRFYARAKPGLPAASWPGAAGSDHGSPLSTQVAPMPWAMSTSVAHLAAAAAELSIAEAVLSVALFWAGGVFRRVCLEGHGALLQPLAW